MIGGDEAVLLGGGVHPVVQPALPDLDHAVAPLAEPVMVMLVTAEPVALLAAVMRQDVHHAGLAQERERPVHGGEAGGRAALAEPAPELLRRHVVALSRQLLEHFEPARRRADAVPLEQLRETLPRRGHDQDRSPMVG